MLVKISHAVYCYVSQMVHASLTNLSGMSMKTCTNLYNVKMCQVVTQQWLAYCPLFWVQKGLWHKFVKKESSGGLAPPKVSLFPLIKHLQSCLRINSSRQNANRHRCHRSLSALTNLARYRHQSGRYGWHWWPITCISTARCYLVFSYKYR